jgi:hypothetical protein
MTSSESIIFADIGKERNQTKRKAEDDFILQKEKQNKGEEFLEYIKLSLTSIQCLSYEDYDKLRQRFNIDSIDPWTIENLRSMIFYEIPRIFDIPTWSSNKNMKLHYNIENFISYANKLKLLSYKNEFKKYIGNYNKALNLILQKVSTKREDDQDIIYKRSIISQMQLYTVCGYFDGCNRSLAIKETNIKEQISVEQRRINYDCTPIMSNQIQIKVRKTFNKVTNQFDHGRAFGFDSIEEAFNCFSVAIENTTTKDLVLEADGSSKIKSIMGGSFLHNNFTFYLKLPLSHGNNLITYINSGEQCIIHIFCNDTINQKTVKKILCAPFCISGVKTLGIYIKYHNLVVSKIKDLISQCYSDSYFPCIMIPCFRPDCGYRNVYSRSERDKPVSALCQKCNIAEFCLTCGKTSHGGKCDFSQDMMTKDWIENNTKPCPSCRINVNKLDGCNHMTCRCGVHFCWICSTEYDVNAINEHYINNNAYNGCINQTNDVPIQESRFRAFRIAGDLDNDDIVVVNLDPNEFFQNQDDFNQFIQALTVLRERERVQNHEDIFINWLQENSHLGTDLQEPRRDL